LLQVDEVAERHRIIGRQRQRALERLRRLGEAIAFLQGDAEADIARHVGRIEPDRLAIGDDRTLAVTQGAQHQGQTVADADMTGIERAGSTIGLDRFRQPAQLMQRDRVIIGDGSVARRQRHGPGEGRHRLIEPANPIERRAGQLRRPKLPRPQPFRRLGGIRRLVRPVERQQAGGELDPGGGQIRRQSDEVARGCDGIVMATEFAQDAAADQQTQTIGPRRRQQGQRVRLASGDAQAFGEIGQNIRATGCGLPRPREQAHRPLVLAALPRQHAQQVQAIDLVGHAGQNALVDALRLGQPAGAMGCDARLQQTALLRPQCRLFDHAHPRIPIPSKYGIGPG
jgi:hypothetical protein